VSNPVSPSELPQEEEQDEIGEAEDADVPIEHGRSGIQLF
jgi:hypothetical protein